MVDRSIDHPLTPKRRWFLKSALVIGAVGATFGGLIYWHRGMSNGKLTEHGRDLIRGLTIGYAGPVLPADKAKREALLESHLKSMEAFMAGLPPVLLTELGAVTGLLSNMPTRRMLTGLGSSWREASDDELAAAVEHMRLNPLPTTRMTYQILRSLICMPLFANSDTWPLIGYPGPINI